MMKFKNFLTTTAIAAACSFSGCSESDDPQNSIDPDDNGGTSGTLGTSKFNQDKAEREYVISEMMAISAKDFNNAKSGDNRKYPASGAESLCGGAPQFWEENMYVFLLQAPTDAGYGGVSIGVDVSGKPDTYAYTFVIDKPNGVTEPNGYIDDLDPDAYIIVKEPFQYNEDGYGDVLDRQLYQIKKAGYEIHALKDGALGIAQNGTVPVKSLFIEAKPEVFEGTGYGHRYNAVQFLFPDFNPERRTDALAESFAANDTVWVNTLEFRSNKAINLDGERTFASRAYGRDLYEPGHLYD